MDSHHCSKFFCKLGDFLDGEMENECCTEMEQHIEGCEKCKIVIRTIRTTMNICHDHATEDVPEKVRLRVRQVIREQFFTGKSIDDF